MNTVIRNIFLFFCVLIFSVSFSCVSNTGSAVALEDAEEVEFIQKKPVGGNYGVFYQIFVGSFSDSNGDGTGDLKGITQKLDYLNNGNLSSNRSLNIDGIWLTPIHPSRTYHKYDVIDYKAVDRSFGTIADFEELTAECKKRGVKVIIDLVLNHTSIDHSWFQEARRGSQKYLNYYNIADSKLSNKYYPLGYAGKFYEGDFWDQMPDLNLDNPDVREEIKSIVNFWFEKGAAGFRLDATSKFFPDHDKNTAFLSWFTEYCKSQKDDVYIVAEGWESAGIVMSYYDSRIPSMFNFTMSDEKGMIPMAAATQNGANITTAMINWNLLIKEKNPRAIDAVFISNHDQNRSAGYFNSDPVKIKTAAALYLTMPGNPFIYYGEEIGMTGSGIDENKRGPMIWSVNSRAGITRGPIGMTQRWRTSAGAEEQIRDPASITRFYIEAIRLRSSNPVLFSGTPGELKTGERAVASWTVTDGSLTLAVLHNLSGAEKKINIEGANELKGTLSAVYSSNAPVLDRQTLILPPFSTAIVRIQNRN